MEKVDHILAEKLLNISAIILQPENPFAVLILGCEFIIPISRDVKNPRRNVPMGMILSLGIVCVMEILVVLGMHNYTTW